MQGSGIRKMSDDNNMELTITPSNRFTFVLLISIIVSAILCLLMLDISKIGTIELAFTVSIIMGITYWLMSRVVIE